MTSSYKNIEPRKRFVLIFQFLYNLIKANYSKLKQRSIEIDFSSYNLKMMNLELSTKLNNIKEKKQILKPNKKFFFRYFLNPIISFSITFEHGATPIPPQISSQYTICWHAAVDWHKKQIKKQLFFNN